ncbi:hypothetical protein [Streptomyces sp. NBC_01217]|uniref:hypothetical protein n=1 Tax=Streptomyces sp. NBC_01217 TaxID=2903779 RepID=UPI002E1379EC|nr:hypothetical protein OG507_04720 [Streptomyces sp. NBC_01217]
MTNPLIIQRAAVAASLCGAAMLACTAAAQPAGAVTYPGVSFYAGVDQTGTEYPVDLTSTGCRTLPQSARSATNLSATDVAVYFNPDCRTGAPGTTGDLYFVLGTLHTATFPYPALSYRVLNG